MTTAEQTRFAATAARVQILPTPDGSIRVAPRDAITPELREALTRHKKELAVLAEPRFNRHVQVCTGGEWFDFHHDPALPGEQIRVRFTRNGKPAAATVRNTSEEFVQLARQLQAIDQKEGSAS